MKNVTNVVVKIHAVNFFSFRIASALFLCSLLLSFILTRVGIPERGNIFNKLTFHILIESISYVDTKF